MAYTAPVVRDVRDRFPAFADAAKVPDTAITAALADAAGRVDTSWLERDFAPAQLLYAAHSLTMDGFGTGADADALGQGAGLYKSIKAGDTAIEFLPGAVGGTISATSYGRRFLELQALNFGGPITAASPAAPCSPLAFDCEPGYLVY